MMIAWLNSTADNAYLSKRNILYSKPVFVQKYILQHAAPKQNIFYVPKSKLVYQEQYYLYEIITPRPIFLSGIQNQIWYLRNHIGYTKIYFRVQDITKWPQESHFKLLSESHFKCNAS